MPGAPVVIVGGGMSGLAAAYELARRNVPFFLLEAAPAFGGVVKTEHIDGFVIDAGPDALLTQKPAASAPTLPATPASSAPTSTEAPQP